MRNTNNALGVHVGNSVVENKATTASLKELNCISIAGSVFVVYLDDECQRNDNGAADANINDCISTYSFGNKDNRHIILDVCRFSLSVTFPAICGVLLQPISSLSSLQSLSNKRLLKFNVM